ncbi:MAG: hypothetical protein QM714_06990 [Nocardioides sp.]|uniref:acyl-CoA thioesterase n=1 Tax=Nocardioides sp. TaxID=35761 RepID=UPI0039E454DA
MTSPHAAEPEPPGHALLVRRHRVGMEDSDASRHIFFGAVQRWHSTLFSNWLAEVGHGILDGLEDGSSTYPVVVTQAEYLSPLWLDDEVDLGLYTDQIGTTSFQVIMLGYRVRDHTLAVKSTTTHVFVANRDRKLSAQPFPDDVRTILERGRLEESVSS